MLDDSSMLLPSVLLNLRIGGRLQEVLLVSPCYVPSFPFPLLLLIAAVSSDAMLEEPEQLC